MGLAPWLLPPPPSGVPMGPEGGPSWGSQVLYTVVPPQAPAPHFNLVYTQPLYQPQILHAVQALAVQPLVQPTTSLPIVTQKKKCQANRTKAWRSGKGCHPEGVLLQKREEDGMED